MDRDIAKWLGAQGKTLTRILYLPGGPIQIGRCNVAQYDVIITKIKPEDLDNKDLMACLWRIGYEFAAPSGVLVLEVDGGWPEADPNMDTYHKMSSIGWCRWDTLAFNRTGIFQRTQRLAPWITDEIIRRWSPNLITRKETEADGADAERAEDCAPKEGVGEAGYDPVCTGEATPQGPGVDDEPTARAIR